MQKVTLKAEARSVMRKQVKNLRKEGLIPAVVYGRGFEPVSVQVKAKEFGKAYMQAGESTLVYLELSDKTVPTIIHDVSRHPVNDGVLHIDFYHVRLDEKIHAKIPLQFTGEAPAVKTFGAILIKNIFELEVEGFPQDLPHEITVDISKLANIGDHIMVQDLKISDKLKLTAHMTDIVALAQEPISEEKLKESLEAAPTAGVEEVEVIKKEKAAEEGEGEAEAAPAEKK